MDISELEVLARQVFNDVRGYVEGMGFDVVPIEVGKLPDDAAGLTFVFYGNRFRLNEELVKDESEAFVERERLECRIAYATVHSALMAYAERHLKEGKAVHEKPAFMGFASGIESWVYQMMDKDHGSRYDFSGFDEETRSKMTKNFSGPDYSDFSDGRGAYDNIRSAFDENGWDGNFEIPTLSYVYIEADEFVFKQIKLKKPVKLLEDYLLSAKIAKMDEEQINIEAVSEAYTALLEKGFESKQWREVKEPMKKIEENVEIFDEKLKKRWGLLIDNLEQIFEHPDDSFYVFYKKIHENEQYKPIRNEMLEVMDETKALIKKHKAEKKRLLFSRLSKSASHESIPSFFHSS